MKRNRAVLNGRVLSAIVLSLLMIVAGGRAIVLPPETGEGLATLAGCLLLLSGATHLVLAWHTCDNGGHRVRMLPSKLGVVCMVAGGYVLVHPLTGLAPLTFIWLVYLLGQSILELILSNQLRPLPGSSWLCFEGITNTLILGIMLFGIWTMWPATFTRVIGTLVGINMLSSGVARLMVSLSPHRVVGPTHEEFHGVQ